MLHQFLTTIVVDDEKPSREALVNYTREFCPGIEIVAECDTEKSAYHAILEHKPHLVFLDIEMPRGNGFDLLKRFDKLFSKVIFVTAFSDYAVQAFRYSATDFLLKPVKVGELIEAVDKVRKELDLNRSNLNLDILLNNHNSPDISARKLVISNSHGFTVIDTADIIMCQADTYCTNFTLTNNQIIKSSHNLRYYEDLLPDHQFMRVHNSFIVNIEHVKSYNNQGYIRLTEENKCSLSAQRKTEFLKFFKNRFS